MKTEDILTLASGGKFYDAVSAGHTRSVMLFKAVNGDAQVKINKSSNIEGIAGKTVKILEGDMLPIRTDSWDLVTGQVIAYDAD